MESFNEDEINDLQTTIQELIENYLEVSDRITFTTENNPEICTASFQKCAEWGASNPLPANIQEKALGFYTADGEVIGSSTYVQLSNSQYTTKENCDIMVTKSKCESYARDILQIGDNQIHMNEDPMMQKVPCTFLDISDGNDAGNNKGHVFFNDWAEDRPNVVSSGSCDLYYTLYKNNKHSKQM